MSPLERQIGRHRHAKGGEGVILRVRRAGDALRVRRVFADDRFGDAVGKIT
jgi:hypothetical protein